MFFPSLAYIVGSYHSLDSFLGLSLWDLVLSIIFFCAVMSGKRKQTGTSSPLEAEAHKRAKGAINSVVKEYMCPIALELPVDPVTAEDGRIYNRADIQQHIDQSKRKKDDGSEEFEYRGLKSPMTKEPMGPNLLPAIQVRNSIRALIDSGAIESDEGSAKKWKALDDLKTKAEGGDPKAMVRIGEFFYIGFEGLMKDQVMAYMWFSKAADLEYPPANGRKGYLLLNGEGTEQNISEGGILIGIAAASGVAMSQFHLACAYWNGLHGINRNLDKAKYWFERAVTQEGEWALSEKNATSARNNLESIKKRGKK